MDAKTCKKEFSGLGLRMVVSALVIYGVQFAGQFILMSIHPEWIDNTDILLASTMIPMYAIGYPITFLILTAGNKGQTIEKHKMKPTHFMLAFLMAYALLMLGNIIGLGVTMGIGFLKGDPVDNSLVDIVGNGNIWISAIYIVILAPIFEEYLFRKIICDRVVKYGQGMAIIMSGMMFGLFHGNFNQFFYATFIGCFFAFIYVKTGNVKYTIGLHMIVNFIGSVLGGLMLQNLDFSGDLFNMPFSSMVIYAFYMLFIYGLVIAGGVLLLVNLSKFKTSPGMITLRKGNRFEISIINVGMFLYCEFFVILMVVQALM
ncbi:MAG: CPBP family intramembrane metalloprotease [Eubacterium sp.]|nr:CPBP family intramembrane metalloprotease [Eubacterium sp.]